MTIWRLHVRPGGITSNSNPTDFCISNKLIAIGWPFKEKISDFQDAIKIAKKEWPDDIRAFTAAFKAFMVKIAKGDLVWFRNLEGKYFLACVTSDFRQINSSEAFNAHCTNARSAEIKEIGTQVAGGLKNQFIQGSTIRRIKNKNLIDYTKLVAAKSFPDKFHNDFPKNRNIESIFSLLDSFDMEDLVGLYLEVEESFCVIPSSRGNLNNTPFYEFELWRPSDRSSAYLQVKNGDRNVLDLSAYRNFKEELYVFSTAGYLNEDAVGGYPNIHLIEKEKIITFLQKYNDSLPKNISCWLELINSAYVARSRSRPNAR